MRDKYLKAKKAIKYTGVSKSTLRRRLSDELKRSGLKWDDSPSLVRERTSNIIKVLEGRDDNGQELYHWEYSIPFLTMVKESVNNFSDYSQRISDHSQRIPDYGQKTSDHSHEESDHSHEESDYSQKTENDSKKDIDEETKGYSDHSQRISDYGHEESDHSQQGFNNKMNMGQSSNPDHSQDNNGSSDHSQEYVHVSKDYFEMLKEEYKAKRKLEEDYRNKDNQINLIVQNLSKAMETLKDRIKALEAPREDRQEEDQEKKIHEVNHLKEEDYE